MSQSRIETSESENSSIKKCPTYSNKTKPKPKRIQPTHKQSHVLFNVKNKLEEKTIIPQRKQRQLNTINYNIEEKKISKALNNASPTNSSLKESIHYTIEKKHKGKEYSILKDESNNILFEFSYKEDKNRIFKDRMEDKGKSVINFNEKPNDILLTLFDGHGGDTVSSFLEHNFDKFLKKNISNEIPLKKSISKTFFDIDNEIKDISITEGSTGTIILLTEENNKKVIYCANIGDTRCCLFNNKDIEQLSYDHRVTDPKEKDRIIHSGGFIRNGRVNGKLMLSRVFGDFEFKHLGVKCEPYIIRKEIDCNIKNQFIVLASDGLWDAIEDNFIEEFIYETVEKENKNESITKQICDRLVTECFNFGSSDNISVFVIKIT